MQRILTILLLLVSVPCTAGGLLIETENFRHKGGWVVDQQFMDHMGSPYLLAHGMGVPVADASTTITLPSDGTYNVYVRTYNWTAPWTTDKGPGRFRVVIDNRALKQELGADGSAWGWQYAGSVKLRSGDATLALRDLTGFDGRCDAVYLTTASACDLPDDGAELASRRRELLGLPAQPAVRQSYDFVVAGGGIAGMCAAVAAARNGCRVALVNDRPVLGGNNSSEVRVHLGGHIELGPNEGLGRMIREFGHARKGNAKPGDYYEDAKKADFIASEPNVTLLANYRLVAAECANGRIESVTVRHVETGEEIALTAPLFADCTGDGTLGVLSGADFRVGREARSEYGESMAPETADNEVMGASVQWYTAEQSKPTRFPEFSYGVKFDADNCERVTMGEWTWETGMNLDQVAQAERIRDYGLLVIYSNWSFLKNHLTPDDRYRNRSLAWVAYVAGKRESRRLLGDYVLKQDDIDKNVFHEDASFAASWSIDLHFPDPKNTKHFPGAEFKSATNHVWIHPYAVPYRCLYSRNVDNLFMAGRNISVTHVALGTVRVMRTTGMMGEVVGMAAALCNRHAVTPRGVYRSHLGELREMMQQGAGKTNVPDNQRFNLSNKLLPAPRAFLDKK